MTNPNIFTQPLHLGLGATAAVQAAIDSPLWYADYETRTAADGHEGRLVSAHRFTENWTSWERHPAGDEVVLCLDGAIVLHQEMADGTAQSITLTPGEYAVNPPGCWHTADVPGVASALFITAGAGTEHRPR